MKEERESPRDEAKAHSAKFLRTAARLKSRGKKKRGKGRKSRY